MRAWVFAAVLVTGCSTAALKPWAQAQHQDEPACLAACEKHDQQCPQIFAAFPERGAVECPASHVDCVKGCKATMAAAAPATAVSTPPPLTVSSPPSASPPPVTASKEAKLRELKRLYDLGLVTDEVYKARQLAILSEP